MPIVTFSARDVLKGKIVTPAWYRMRIEQVGEKPSNDGGSTNYPVEGTIIRNADDGSTDFQGVPIDWNFNSKAIGFAIGFLTALGVDVKPNERIELGASAGKEIDVFVENDTYQNRLVNRVNHKYRAPRN